VQIVRFKGELLEMLGCDRLLEMGTNGAGIEKVGVGEFDFN
jgi:hypothetical protein